MSTASAAAGRRRWGSGPYPSARLRARGTVRLSDRAQQTAITAFQRPGLVTYSVLAFRNARVRSHRTDRAVAWLLASLRGRPPS